MDLYVKNIDKNKKKTWRTIYKAIGEGYFVKVKLFTREYFNLCKNHPNEPQNIPTDIKKNIKTISLEDSLHDQVVSIRCKSIVLKKDTGNEPKRNYLFQVYSAIPEHWFDIDIEWVGKNISKREPQFYKRLFQTNIEGQSGITYPIFCAPIGIAK